MIETEPTLAAAVVTGAIFFLWWVYSGDNSR